MVAEQNMSKSFLCETITGIWKRAKMQLAGVVQFSIGGNVFRAFFRPQNIS